MRLFAQFKSTLNMGWYDDKAVYYNISEDKFYITNIKKNSTGILFLSPIVTTILGEILNNIALVFSINFIEQLILIVIFIIISSLSAWYSVFLMKKNAHFKLIEFYPGQMKDFLSKAQKHNRFIFFISIFLLLLDLFLIDLLISVNDFQILIIFGITFVGFLMLIIDYRPIYREKLIRKLKQDIVD